MDNAPASVRIIGELSSVCAALICVHFPSPPWDAAWIQSARRPEEVQVVVQAIVEQTPSLEVISNGLTFDTLGLEILRQVRKTGFGTKVKCIVLDEVFSFERRIKVLALEALYLPYGTFHVLTDIAPLMIR